MSRPSISASGRNFHRCRYGRLADGLPRLICGGHTLAAASDTAEISAPLAGIHTLTTRMLIKLDDQQLGWMAADRARVLAVGSGDPLTRAEAARNLAVLACKAGWHTQAASIALTAPGDPALGGARLATARDAGSVPSLPLRNNQPSAAKRDVRGCRPRVQMLVTAEHDQLGRIDQQLRLGQVRRQTEAGATGEHHGGLRRGTVCAAVLAALPRFRRDWPGGAGIGSRYFRVSRPVTAGSWEDSEPCRDCQDRSLRSRAR